MFTEAESSALRMYSSSRYRDINAFLRGLEELPSDCLGIIELIDRAIEKSTLQADLVVYRGVNVDVGDHFRRIGLVPGDQFSDSAFASTSADPGPARIFAAWPPGGLILKIYLKAGMLALDMSNFSDFPNEREMLLPRGLSYRIMAGPSPEGIIEMEAMW